jgi:hypothetical protein
MVRLMMVVVSQVKLTAAVVVENTLETTAVLLFDEDF